MRLPPSTASSVRNLAGAPTALQCAPLTLNTFSPTPSASSTTVVNSSLDYGTTDNISRYHLGNITRRYSSKTNTRRRIIYHETLMPSIHPAVSSNAQGLWPPADQTQVSPRDTLTVPEGLHLHITLALSSADMLRYRWCRFSRGYQQVPSCLSNPLRVFTPQIPSPSVR